MFELPKVNEVWTGFKGFEIQNMKITRQSETEFLVTFTIKTKQEPDG